MQKPRQFWIVSATKLLFVPVTGLLGLLSTLFPAAAQQVIPTAVGAGTAVSKDGDRYDVSGGTQAGGNLFHEFDEFSLAAQETANFLGDSSVFNIVGQVSGLNPSYIDGRIAVSGSDANLYLINPAGVLFGPDAQLSLSGSFTAATADQIGFGEAWLDVLEETADYGALTADPSAFRFTAAEASAVVNQGDLAVAAGESLTFLGGDVLNEGRLDASGGELGLVAVGGESTVRLGVPGGLLSLEVTEQDLLPGRVFAPTDLSVLLTGGAASNASAISVLADGTVNLSGLSLSAGSVATTGELTTRSRIGNGGTIALLGGGGVSVLDAVVDASGEAGGTVLVGSGIRGQDPLPLASGVFSNQRSVIRADGQTGSGGDIVVGSQVQSVVFSTLSARGATEGGFVQTSSADRLAISGVSVDVSGQASEGGGLWLINSSDIAIVEGALGFNQIAPGAIESALDVGADVEIAMSAGTGIGGDISLLSSISQTGASDASLTLTGRRFRANGSTIDLASTGPLTYQLNAVNPEATSDSISIESAIAAIGNVSGNRLISLGAGDYDFSGALDINTAVEIEGAGRNATILRELGGDRLFNVGANGDVGFDNLTFSGASRPLEVVVGGGIRNVGTLRIDNSVFVANVATTGGAIFNGPGGDLVVSDSTFVNNRAENGGAVLVDNESVGVFSDVLFLGNSAGDIANSNGGGLYVRGGSVTTQSGTRFEANRSETGSGGGLFAIDSSDISLSDTIFERNTAVLDGGGVSLVFDSDVTVDAGSRFTNNTAGGDGGGLYLSRSSTAMVDGARFVGNQAADGGGVSAQQGSRVAIASSSRLVDNRADDNGGGLHLNNSTAAVSERSVFRDNAAGASGGGLAAVGNSALTMDESALENNRAGLDGGAIALSETATAALTILSVSGNSAGRNGGGIQLADAAMLDMTSSSVDGNRATANGGGLYLDLASTIRLQSSSVLDNIAEGDGGGLALNGSSSGDFEGVTARGNEAFGEGGGVAVLEASHLVVENSSFENNRAVGNGGGLYSNHDDQGIPSGDSVVVDNSRLINNEAANGGGFYQGLGGTASISNSLFRANQATTHGGGLYAQRDIAIAETELVENVAQLGGGLLIDSDANLSLTNSTLDANRAVEGGGLFNRSAAELSNTTLSNNVATSEGGGLKNTGANAILSVRNSTVYENEAGQGGGILADSAQATRVLNTIVAGNVVSGNASETGHDVSGDFSDQGNNLIGSADGSSGFTNSPLLGTAVNPLDPRLAPLADNGGPTRTHLLQSDSLAINSGRADGLPTTDQRGLSRVVGSAVDIGAVEFDGDFEVPEIPSTPSNPSTPEEEVVPTTVSFSEPTLLMETTDSRSSEVLGNRGPEMLSDNEAIRRLEQNFGQGFEDYWDIPLGQELSFERVQSILRRAQSEYEVNSAVVYAAFAPEEKAQEDASNVLQFEADPSGDDLLHLAVVMPEGKLVSYELPVTRREAERQVRMLRSTTADPEDNFGYQPLSQQLYQWLLAPLEADLAAQGIQNLMYALDRGLRTAPVTVMRDDNGFSLERYGISVVPNVSLMQADFPASVRRPTIAMGVSEFDIEQPLPAVPIELDVVKSTVPVSQTLLNEDTTSEAIASIQALEQPGILHLATHASFDTHSPDSSAIELWDGPLTMREFSDLDWRESNLELLILSACSTAMSSPNAELGFAGLAAAAGVDATVGSLWQVSDVGTLALMSEFYIHLESTPLRFEALRQAQLSLLNKETRIENGNLITSAGEVDLPDEWDLPDEATLDHPFFWSAFTMVGNPW